MAMMSMMMTMMRVMPTMMNMMGKSNSRCLCAGWRHHALDEAALDAAALLTFGMTPAAVASASSTFSI
eukprot:10505053-Lingulodinium_polyedra.AAC.1